MSGIFRQNKNLQSYTLVSLDVEVDLSGFIITLSRNDKMYPKTEKNPCKPDFENALLGRSGDWNVSARSLLLTGQIV